MEREEALHLLRGGPEGVLEWNRRRPRGNEPFDLDACDLARAYLFQADLSGVSMQGADLERANLQGAILRAADLRKARLARANLRGAVLSACDAGLANLREADLRGTNLSAAHLSGADLTRAFLGLTAVGCTLYATKGLDTVVHLLPSQVSIDAILSMEEELSEPFLLGCGVLPQDVAYFRARSSRPVAFYSCFISYAVADEEFATRLHEDLRAAGIRCWKWTHDARTGRTLWGEIDQAIRLHDKLVLIASESALKSPAVEGEIERALQREDELKRRKAAGETVGDVNVLFPVQIDDHLLHGWQHERRADVVKKVVADARGWRSDPAAYARIRDRLIADLKRG